MDNVKRIERLFPKYFELFTLPEGAHDELITVYRACKTWTCDKESFTPTYEERGMKYLPGEDVTDPSIYSLSTFEKPNHVKWFAMTSESHPKPYKIAIGVAEPECGPVQRTKERKGRSAKSHVDWWLYEGAEPQRHFSIIDNFEEYLEKQKQETKGGE